MPEYFQGQGCTYHHWELLGFWIKKAVFVLMDSGFKPRTHCIKRGHCIHSTLSFIIHTTRDSCSIQCNAPSKAKLSEKNISLLFRTRSVWQGYGVPRVQSGSQHPPASLLEADQSAEEQLGLGQRSFRADERWVHRSHEEVLFTGERFLISTHEPPKKLKKVLFKGWSKCLLHSVTV